MPDVMTPRQRRKAMKSNRGRTRPEKAFASALWRLGYRYLTSDGYRKRFGFRLPGNPDVILLGIQVVIFVDGCFWHGCTRCHDFRASCSSAWQAKIDGNRARDARNRQKLRRMGWRVWRVWEHDLRKKSTFEKSVARFRRRLQELTNVC